jgi:hypothetical protein
MKIKELKKRYKRAMKHRGHWESGYQEVYDYCLPGRQSFFNRNVTEDQPEIFDETAVIGLQEFASRMQAGMVPNYAKWVMLEAGTAVPEEQRAEINKELERITDVVFEHINASNFGQEAHEFLIDIGLGTAAMEIVEGDSINPIIFNAVPLPELALDCGHRDELDSFYRCRTRHVSDIKRLYGVNVPKKLVEQAAQNCEVDDKDDPPLKVVTGVYRDPDKENEYVYKRCVFLLDAEDEDGVLKMDTLTGLGANPFIGARWSKVAGEAWGRGPAYNLMPAIRVLNLVTQLTLENAEMAIAGLYFYEDDGVIDAENVVLRPGTMAAVAPGSSGIKQFNTSTDFNVGDLIASRIKQDINKGLYNDTLGPTDTTPMSATEVAQRMADLSRQIGSAFGRLQVEFVNAVLQRVLYILKRKGKIKIPVVDGRQIKIVATSPLAQAQAVEEINGVTNWLAVIAANYGPEGVNLYTDGAEVAKYTQEKFNVPERLYRNEQNRKAMVENIAKAQQAGGELPPNVQSITG